MIAFNLNLSNFWGIFDISLQIATIRSDPKVAEDHPEMVLQSSFQAANRAEIHGKLRL